ncbi:MAG: FkbM family methyltransferase [Sphingobacteriia bacterium]|jgi:FkbM family methyltransferase
MKSAIKIYLQALFNPFIVKLGYQKKAEYQEYNKNYLLNNFYVTLKKINFQPNHILDIGANHGSWTRKALEYFPEAYYSLFEPQYWLKESVEDLLKVNRKIQFYGVGVSDVEGSFKFTIVDRDDSCSFLYSQEEALKNGFKQLDIPVNTVNNLLSNSNFPIPDIIKIDAEGLDINVLKGASNYYDKTEIFMVEAAVMNKVFENDVYKITHFMNEIGYKLFDITDLNRTLKHNALWLVEFVFIKKNGFVDRAINSYD